MLKMLFLLILGSFQTHIHSVVIPHWGHSSMYNVKTPVHQSISTFGVILYSHTRYSYLIRDIHIMSKHQYVSLSVL